MVCDKTYLLEPHVAYLHAQLRLGVSPFALSERLLADRGVSVGRRPMRTFLKKHPLEAPTIMRRPAARVASVEPAAWVILRRLAASMPEVSSVCTQAGLAAYHDFLVALFREGLPVGAVKKRLLSDKHVQVVREALRNYQERCIDVVYDYTQTSAFTSATPLRRAQLSDYAGYIKEQVSAGLGRDSICRKLWDEYHVRVAVHVMGDYLKWQGSVMGYGCSAQHLREHADFVRGLSSEGRGPTEISEALSASKGCRVHHLMVAKFLSGTLRDKAASER